MSKKILYISDGYSSVEYALNSDLDVEENVEFVLDASELANPNFVSIDSFYHKQIDNLDFNEYGLILIPNSLSEDVYISFSGIRLGVHLRLNETSKHLPILFIGPDSFTELCKFSDYAGFLSSPGIYTLSEDKNQVKDIAPLASYILDNHQSISESKYFESLKNFNIKESGFLDSRHSRANEYGLLKLDMESGHSIFANNNKSLEIVSDLYTKWLMAKSGLELPTARNKAPKKQVFTIPSDKKRILIIEDEWEKGWLKLYKKIFLGANVEHLPIQKGNKWEEDIKPMLSEKLKEDWDLFLVDIRLADEDFKNLNYKGLSGFKALDLIKNKNRGCQVCVTSASNKQWIYDYGREVGADEIWSKPSIETEEKNPLELFSQSIENCFNRNYLKLVYEITSNIKDNVRTKLNQYFVDPNYPSWLTQEQSLKEVNKLANSILEQIELFETVIDLNKKNEHNLYKQPLIVLHQIFELFYTSQLNFNLAEKTRPFDRKIYLKSEELKIFNRAKGIFQNDSSRKTFPFKSIAGKYSYQVNQNSSTHGVLIDPKEITISSKDKEYFLPWTEPLLILLLRHQLQKEQLDRFQELKNLRHNYCGHDTGNYNVNLRPIRPKDITDYLHLLENILLPL